MLFSLQSSIPLLSSQSAHLVLLFIAMQFMLSTSSSAKQVFCPVVSQKDFLAASTAISMHVKENLTIIERNGVGVFRSPLRQVAQIIVTQMGPAVLLKAIDAMLVKKMLTCTVWNVECTNRALVIHANLARTRAGFSHYVGAFLAQYLQISVNATQPLKDLYLCAESQSAENVMNGPLSWFNDLSHGVSWYTMSNISFWLLTASEMNTLKESLCFREMWFFLKDCAHGLGHGLVYSFVSSTRSIKFSTEQQLWSVALSDSECDTIVMRCAAFTLQDARSCSVGVYHSIFSTAPRRMLDSKMGMDWCSYRLWPIACFIVSPQWTVPLSTFGIDVSKQSEMYTQPGLQAILQYNASSWALAKDRFLNVSCAKAATHLRRVCFSRSSEDAFYAGMRMNLDECGHLCPHSCVHLSAPCVE